MLFNSLSFMLFFPIVVLLYWIIPKRGRSIWLLLASYYFYMSWNPEYALLLALSTLTTFFSGIMIEKVASAQWKKTIVSTSLIVNLCILLIFKYANFALETCSWMIEHLGMTPIERRFDILLPVGISFYTFQALGYTLDVYRNKCKAEKSMVNYALFVSFFPQLVAGPIERSDNLLNQIRKMNNISAFHFERVKDGLLLMVWGFFQKLVIADRASILVNQVYHNYRNYGFLELSVASVLFAFQIYCDFGGYTNIARGAAKVLGFTLMNNFRQPYLASDIKDFWRRWHISLTTWFTDYLYIPLGGNRKGILRQYLNIFIVFGISGLWHGANWHYVLWGLLHACFRIIGNIRTKLSMRFLAKDEHYSSESVLSKIRKIFITFVMVDFAWVLFAADSIHSALAIFKQMLTGAWSLNVLDLGINESNWIILIASIIALIGVDVIHEKGISINQLIHSQNTGVKMLLYNGLIWWVILFGIYGVGYDTSQFIYFRF